jgi:hypothetical protein
MIAAPRVGKPTAVSTLDANGSPLLAGKMNAIWQKFLMADKKLAEREGRTWNKHAFSAAWGNPDLNSAIVNMLHSPPPNQPQKLYNFKSWSTQMLHSKLATDLTENGTAQYGALIFDLCRNVKIPLQP